MVATTFPLLSAMSVFSVALTAAERLFCTSVLICTVLDEPEFVARVGVVTQVPYQATCSGSATTTFTSRYRPPWKVWSPVMGGICAFQLLVNRTATVLSPDLMAEVTSMENPL